MALRSIKSLDKINIDPFEAIKRALIRRGTIPRQSVSKDIAKPQEKAEERPKHPDELMDLTNQSHEVLYKANSVFPFTLFPDTIILDRVQLSIIHRYFFRMAKITSIRVEDVLMADVQVGPFFGSLNIATRYFINQTDDDGEKTKAPSIDFLWKHDVMAIHKLLQGFIIACQRGIDLSCVSKDKLIETLHELGQNEDTIHEK
jgi:hypothetical protein